MSAGKGVGGAPKQLVVGGAVTLLGSVGPLLLLWFFWQYMVVPLWYCGSRGFGGSGFPLAGRRILLLILLFIIVLFLLLLLLLFLVVVVVIMVSSSRSSSIHASSLCTTSCCSSSCSRARGSSCSSMSSIPLIPFTLLLLP